MPATAAPGAPAAYPYDDPRAALVLLNRRRDVAARYLRGEFLRIRGASTFSPERT